MVKPPRTALTNFPRGATVGEPNNPLKQKEILRKTLNMLEESKIAGEVKVIEFQWELKENI